VKAVQLLIKRGANIDTHNDNLQTTFQLAEARGIQDIKYASDLERSGTTASERLPATTVKRLF
jgi:hypothetical protein